MNEIKAKLTGIIKHTNLKETHCALPISMEQEYCKGEKFEASLKLALKKFGKVSVIIADSCYAFTLAQEKHFTVGEAEKELEQLREDGRELGQKWLDAHLPIIHKLEKEMGFPEGTVTITRWDDVIAHPEYQPIYISLLEQFKSRLGNFHKAVVKSTGQFFARHRKTNEEYNLENDNVQLSARYIVDEAAAAKVWKRVEINGRKINYLAYAGSVNEAIRYVLKEKDELNNETGENKEEDIHLLLFNFVRPKVELCDNEDAQLAPNTSTPGSNPPSPPDSYQGSSSATAKPILQLITNQAVVENQGSFVEKMLYMQIQQLSAQIDQLSMLANTFPDGLKKNALLTEIQNLRTAQNRLLHTGELLTEDNSPEIFQPPCISQSPPPSKKNDTLNMIS